MNAKQAKALALQTADAYSADRYKSWEACALALHGFTVEQAEAILRSKHMRWAADEDGKECGKVTSSALVRYIAKYPAYFTTDALRLLTEGK